MISTKFTFFISAFALSLVHSLVFNSARVEAAEISTGARPVPAAGSASATAPVKPRDNGVAAVVRTDGAMMYAKPDFDADLLGTLKKGDKIRVSSGTTGDFAKFHKARAGSLLGYIAEIDVQVEGAAKKRDHVRGAGTGGAAGVGAEDEAGAAKSGKKSGRRKKSSKSVDGKSTDGKNSDARAADKKKYTTEPIFFTRYVGVTVGMWQFNEAIAGVDSHESLLSYGLKVTGPDVLLTGPIMELNLGFHYGAPSYYESLSKTKPSGFLAVADILLLYPLIQRDSAVVTFGLGPAFKLSNFSVNPGEPKSLTQFDLALAGALSGGLRFGRYALRLDGKLVLAKYADKLFQLSLQQEF